MTAAHGHGQEGMTSAAKPRYHRFVLRRVEHDSAHGYHLGTGRAHVITAEGDVSDTITMDIKELRSGLPSRPAAPRLAAVAWNSYWNQQIPLSA